MEDEEGLPQVQRHLTLDRVGAPGNALRQVQARGLAAIEAGVLGWDRQISVAGFDLPGQTGAPMEVAAIGTDRPTQLPNSYL
jgi:hypothetical protein